MKLIYTVLTLIIACFSANCGAKSLVLTENHELVKTASGYSISAQPDSSKIENQKVRPKRRLIAAFLCATLGPFGMHRLYLGTQPRVAGAYTLTLGGGLGIVPAMDLLFIVFSRDISRFKNNDNFIMWSADK
jgi:TM2 domain-containing membrane protein YozV